MTPLGLYVILCAPHTSYQVYPSIARSFPTTLALAAFCLFCLYWPAWALVAFLLLSAGLCRRSSLPSRPNPDSHEVKHMDDKHAPTNLELASAFGTALSRFGDDVEGVLGADAGDCFLADTLRSIGLLANAAGGINVADARLAVAIGCALQPTRFAGVVIETRRDAELAVRAVANMAYADGADTFVPLSIQALRGVDETNGTRNALALAPLFLALAFAVWDGHLSTQPEPRALACFVTRVVGHAAGQFPVSQDAHASAQRYDTRRADNAYRALSRNRTIH